MGATVPAFVLVLAGMAKLRDPFLAALFLHYTINQSIPVAMALTRTLAGVEVLVGVAVVLAIGRSPVPALLALGLYALFVGLLVRVLHVYPAAATCGCFGDLFSGVGQHHLKLQCIFDVAMMALLAIHLVLVRRVKTGHGEPAR